MPIYSYRCDACGHAKDVLQKMSDALLTVCPVCGAPAFKKQLTAAGFQLKGSGWYVTDFRDGNKEAKKGEKGEKGEKSVEASSEGTVAASTTGKSPDAGSSAAAAAPSPTLTSAPAPASVTKTPASSP